MQLNEEQTAAVEHPLDKPACLIAGAGSGKTRVLTERVRWLMDSGVAPNRICAVTFTNKAANEMARRLNLEEYATHNVPRISTIHSLALSGIRKNPKGFGLKDKVTPLDDYDQKQMMKKIIDRHKFEDDTTSMMFQVLDKISFHRARGVGFRKEYTDNVHEQALKMHAGYHAMDETELELWEEFEIEKQKNSVVDFDDMIHLCVRRMRTDERWLAVLHRQFDHVLMDEVQDTNQCHPPGTLVRKYIGYKNRKALTFEVPIEQLKAGDMVVAWRRRWGKLTAKGSPVKVGKRWYEGDLIEVTCGENTVRMTPDHRVYAMLNGDGEDSYVVYLMWRKGYGYRVGQCALRYCQDTKHKSLGGVGARFVEEKANRGWILRVCKTKQESRAWEQIISCRYGIPTTQFEPSNGEQHQKYITTVFANVAGRGEECLVDCKFLAAYPLFLRETDGKRKLPSKRYFETRAVNLIPGLMSLPSTKPNTQVRIDAVKRVPYRGWVYSLDVQTWHTYVANGVVVKNCQWEFINGLLHPENLNMYVVGDANQSVYGFNGASPELFINYSKEWRGVVPSLYKIARNHRSIPEIVDFANLICKKMTATIPIQMESWRGINGEHGEVRKIVAAYPQSIAAIIAQEIQRDSRNGLAYKDNALLVRAGIQIRDLESELIRRRIPYVVRGGRGLLTTEEIRDIMAYMRLAANHKDFMALVRAAGAPKCGVGEATLEKIRQQANEKYDGDLIQAAREQRKLGMFCDTIEHVSLFKDSPIAAVEKVVAMSNYKEYVRQKYKKEPGRVQSKLENIERFNMMIIMLVQEGNMSLDDLIFNLTLDRPKGDEAEEREAVLKAYDEGKITKDELDAKIKVLDQGSVTITTIHSAKGLEWKRVYVTNLYEGSLPHKFSLGSDEEIEEERRLFYVACTRARDSLVLCVPERQLQRSQDGTAKETRLMPSRFLLEIGA